MSEWLRPVVLEAAGFRLEPLEARHLPLLAQTVDEDTFRYFTSRPEDSTPEALGRHFDARPERPRVPFAVFEAAAGRCVGSSAFFDAQPAHRGIEVGYTWFAPDARGTRANPAAKLAMLAHAFEALGAVRVQLKTDERNLASRAAIAKLGAREEGRLRNHRILPDGHLRTTVLFSILDSEWPEVRARLVVRAGLG